MHVYSNHEGMSTRSAQVNPERTSPWWRQVVAEVFRAWAIPELVVM